MKKAIIWRAFITMLLIAASAATAWAQEKLPFPTDPEKLLKTDIKTMLKYSDSISTYFYPGFFNPGKNGRTYPEFPRDTHGEYYSPLQKN